MSGRFLKGLATSLLVLAVAEQLCAEVYPLELKRMTDLAATRRTAENVFFGVSSQHFWYESGGDRAEAFKQAVKKEPAKYACDRPLKGVAELGGKRFVFVLDSNDLKKEGFHRLYFDFNGNGDLTDEQPLEAGPIEDERGWAIERCFFPLEVRLDLNGQPLDYPFWIGAASRFEDQNYAYAALAPAAYRQAAITVDGQKHHLAIIDYNSNGRFNDEFKIHDNVISSDQSVWPEYGDMVVVDGKPRKGEYYWDINTGESRQYLSKLLSIDGRYYEVQVTPTGDKLTLTPAKLQTGRLTNNNERFRAVIYGDRGLIKISGRKGQPVAVPEGEWKLLSCCIEPGDATATRPVGGSSASSGSTNASLSEANRSGKPAKESEPTRLVARGRKDYKPVKITSGKAAELPFGPPYKPVVTAESRREPGILRLQMSLIGVGGEVCSDLMLNGDRPGEPSFAIVAPDGEIVERGKFEYG